MFVGASCFFGSIPSYMSFQHCRVASSRHVLGRRRVHNSQALWFLPTALRLGCSVPLRLTEFIDGAARLRGSAKALDVWRGSAWKMATSWAMVQEGKITRHLAWFTRSCFNILMVQTWRCVFEPIGTAWWN